MASDTVQYIEESRRSKRFEPLANARRIVLLSYARSTCDGQMKWWLHDRVDYGYTEEGFAHAAALVARDHPARHVWPLSGMVLNEHFRPSPASGEVTQFGPSRRRG